MYTDIIVGWDGSEGARDALALARLLSGDDGTVTATCVHSGEAPARGLPSSREALDALAPLASDSGGGATPVAVEAESVAAGLTATAVARDAPLIVIGSSRHGPPGRVHTGGSGRSLVGQTQQTLAIAPRGYRATAGPERRVVAVIDGAHQLCAVAEAAAVAASIGATLSVLCVVPQLGRWAHTAGYPSDEIARRRHAQYQSLLTEATDNVDCTDARLVDGAHLAGVLAGLTGHATLVVTGPAATGTLERTLAGVTSGVLQSARCPVLICGHETAGAASNATTGAARA